MSPHTHIEPVLILGGGLAGLSTAFHLRRPWLLVEKESRVGGLVRTEVMHGGFRFDPTGHWLHLRDPGMKSLVHEQLLPDGLVTVARRAAVFTAGVFTRFPYQVNTHGLPAEVVAENLLGFVEATVGEGGRALREREPANFEEFILRHLGAGFAKNFMVPYNTKLFGVPPRELSAAWCGRFVPKPSLKEVVDGALGLGSDALGYNASFVYPKEGGIEGLARALHGALPAGAGEIRVSTEPAGPGLGASRGPTLRWERGPLVVAGLDHSPPGAGGAAPPRARRGARSGGDAAGHRRDLGRGGGPRAERPALALGVHARARVHDLPDRLADCGVPRDGARGDLLLLRGVLGTTLARGLRAGRGGGPGPCEDDSLRGGRALHRAPRHPERLRALRRAATGRPATW